ncbi:MAG: DUF1566 domain-containing protein [Deferribacterales bacterium]
MKGEPNEDAEVNFSVEIEGKKYTQEQLSVSGDVGKVVTGSNKVIYWDVLKDFPRGLVGNVNWFLDVGGKGYYYIDPATGLMWQDNEDAITVKRDWEGAEQYCSSLTLAGYSDWYLPSIKQLESIIDKSRYPAMKQGFKNVAAYDYRSSTTIASLSSDAWYIYFLNGEVFYSSKTTNSYVRCVRSGQ